MLLSLWICLCVAIAGYSLKTTDPGSIRRRSWGKVHLIRSGKRADVTWQDDETETSKEQQHTKNTDNHGQEIAELGIDLDALDNYRLRRIYRSDSGRIKRGRLARFGGGHMLRSGKRSFQDKDNSIPIIEDLHETE